MKAIPTVENYMTATPHAINSEAAVEEATKLMDKIMVRHLPVMKNGRVFGVVSDRDIRHTSINPRMTKVSEICEDHAFEVPPWTPVDEVAKTMAERKIGSALIIDDEKLVGIFTTTDALKALVDVCHSDS